MKMLKSTWFLRGTIYHMQTLSHWPTLPGYFWTSSSSIRQFTHQIHIFPIWREGCYGELCQRPYWSPDRRGQWLSPCLVTQLNFHEKPWGLAGRACPCWSCAGYPISLPRVQCAVAQFPVVSVRMSKIKGNSGEFLCSNKLKGCLAQFPLTYQLFACFCFLWHSIYWVFAPPPCCSNNQILLFKTKLWQLNRSSLFLV